VMVTSTAPGASSDRPQTSHSAPLACGYSQTGQVITGSPGAP
jgi:hypothetical protein